MIVLGRQSTTGVELGSKPLRTGQYWFVNGFGHGLEHAEENILMERIENVPVQEAEMVANSGLFWPRYFHIR